MDAKDNAGDKDSPEHPNDTCTIRDQAHHIVVMPATPGDGNTGTPVVQDFNKCQKFSTSKNLSKIRHQEKARDFGLSAFHGEICEFIGSKFHQTPEPADTVYGSRSEPVSLPPDAEVTNAFGRIKFRNDVTSIYEPPYARIHPFDRKEDLITLMSKHWRLPDPKLIVSVVGGNESFEFANLGHSSQFKRGLIDIATTTGAWILTPGSNTGVYEMIGSAVKEHIQTAGSAAMNEIVLLGIASWGSVAGRDKLVNDADTGLNRADYPILDITGGEGTRPLDPNHSHFILVDDGTRDQFGGEIKWRAAFEKFLTEHVIPIHDKVYGQEFEKQVSVPMVTLFVNGDEGSLEACLHSLTEGVPLVAIAGSGRAAQVIVLIHQLYSSHKKAEKKGQANEEWSPSNKDLIDIYKRAMASEPSDKVVDGLKVIANHCELISVFDFAPRGTSSVDDLGLDTAIMSAISNKLEKCATCNGERKANKKAELRLALAWNRVDYARDYILNSSNPHYKDFVEQETLSDVALEALVDDMPDFVALLIDRGLDWKTFFKCDHLELLYEESMSEDEACARIVKIYFENYLTQNENEWRRGKMERDDLDEIISGLVGASFGLVSDKDVQHLFIWAIIFNRMEFAELFWKYSQDNVVGAIIGAVILRHLAKASNDQGETEAEAEYLSSSKLFDQHATRLLDVCWCKDQQGTSDMLVRISKKWGDATVLSYAHNAGMEEFLAHPACYYKLNQIWRGDIALQTPLWRIYLFAVLPFMVFLLKFVHQDDVGNTSPVKPYRPNTSRVTYKPFAVVRCTSNNRYEISFFNAMIRAFTSPIVMCIHYSLLFLSFLAVYALFLMTELRPFTTTTTGNATGNATGNSSSIDDSCGVCCPMSFSRIGCLEFITYACALSMLLEDLRQILFRDSKSQINVKLKQENSISNVWIRMDIVSWISFAIALIFRFESPVELFHWVGICFCFSLMIHCIRFSKILLVVEQLGPKIIMIKKMMEDLVFFLVFLSLTIFTFGVICQSILYPQSPLGWALVNDVLYKPYFQMYGELFLEEFDGGYKWILLGFYMILTNVLLLNLLIAMFSYTFQKVQDKSEVLWKYNYYDVVYEHSDKRFIPLLGTLVQIIKEIKRLKDEKNLRRLYNCRCCCGSDPHDKHPGENNFCLRFNERKDKRITNLVKACMEKYVSQLAKLKSEDMAHKVTHTSKRLELVIESQGNLKSQLDQMNEMMRTLLQQQSSPVQSSSVKAQ